MSLRIKWSVLPTAVASVALAAGNVAPSLPASAQSAPLPSSTPTSDPPARVGWLSSLSGAVSFHSASDNQWVTATQNYPVATGDAVWTQPQAAASVMVDESRIALNGGTELTAQEIDEATITAALSQGEAFLDIAALQQGQSVVIETPRGTAQITANGEYELYAGDSGTPTYVTALTGSIQFTGLGAATPQTVGAQQTLVVSGTNPVQAQLGPIQQDQFLTAMLRQITPPAPPNTTQAPAVTAQMTGASVLAQYGAWQPQPSVGTVWFPQVAPSWVPYREGRWAYVQPWGWTWVDNEPWGFAPFHYGRWAQFGGRWGWVPAPSPDEDAGYGTPYQPVYAPALVTFLGAAVGAALTAAAFSSGDIGWAPLGPHEPYYPPYPVSPRYFGAYNRAYVPNYNQFYQRNVTIVNNRVSYRNLTVNDDGHGRQPNPAVYNRQGATFVPREAMLASRPLRSVARSLPADAQVEPFRPEAAGTHELPRPTAATWGVTRGLAQREHLPPAPPGAAPRGPAPGPAIRPIAAQSVARGVAPPLVAHASIAPSFRSGAAAHGASVPGQPAQAPPRAGIRAGAAPTDARPGIPGAPAQRGLPLVAAPSARGGEASRPAFHSTAQGIRPSPPTAAEQHPAPGAPRAIAPRPAPGPRVEAPRPATAPRVEAPRPAPAPRVEAPRPAPAPRVEAPRPAPAPRVEAPRPAPAPRVEAPRPAPAPRVEAPRPAPAPRVEAPRPAPRTEAPRPPPHSGEAPHHEVRPPPK